MSRYARPRFLDNVNDKATESREFEIPKLGRERSLYGNEFELRLRNELSQSYIAKECADWAISFREGLAKHIYFVAETKGDTSDLQLREVEKAKIECARRHFSVISSDTVKYSAVSSYSELLSLVNA